MVKRGPRVLIVSDKTCRLFLFLWLKSAQKVLPMLEVHVNLMLDGPVLQGGPLLAINAVMGQLQMAL